MREKYTWSKDKTIIALFLGTLFITGGRPISSVCFMALEKCYSVNLPSYNIAEIIDLVESGSETIKVQQNRLQNKISVDSYAKFMDMLYSKDIKYERLENFEDDALLLRVEQNENVEKLESLAKHIEVEGDYVLSIKYLNEQEAIITLRR